MFWKGRWRTCGTTAAAASASRRVLHQIPVSRGDVDLRAIVLLKVGCASEVVRVSVRDEDHLDLRRVQPELLKSRKQLRLHLSGRRLRIVAAERVDHQQARRS